MLVRIYPENPNQKEIDKVVKVLQDGGLVVYPTDTVYAIGCDAASFQRFTRTGKKSESVYRTITSPVHWYNPWEIQS